MALEPLVRTHVVQGWGLMVQRVGSGCRRVSSFGCRAQGRGIWSLRERAEQDRDRERWTALKTRHTLEPLAWHWSHWSGLMRFRVGADGVA